MTIDEMRKLVGEFDKLLGDIQKLRQFIHRVENVSYLMVFVGTKQDVTETRFCEDEEHPGLRPLLLEQLRVTLKGMEVKVEDFKRRFR